MILCWSPRSIWPAPGSAYTHVSFGSGWKCCLSVAYLLVRWIAMPLASTYSIFSSPNDILGTHVMIVDRRAAKADDDYSLPSVVYHK
jgi:hypothetical protein